MVSLWVHSGSPRPTSSLPRAKNCTSTWEKGSSRAPNFDLVRRTPRATARTRPCPRVSSVMMRSASPSFWVRSTMPSSRNRLMGPILAHRGGLPHSPRIGVPLLATAEGSQLHVRPLVAHHDPGLPGTRVHDMTADRWFGGLHFLSLTTVKKRLGIPGGGETRHSSVLPLS